METSQSGGSTPAPRREYDPEIAHTIWELERTVRKGKSSEATRRVLLEAHATQLQAVEERAGVPAEGRSFLLLQPRVAPGVLLFPGEGAYCDGLRLAARYFHKAGFNVMATSLAYRNLESPETRPHYWQTCLDEAENRYDMLRHYASRITVLGVGLGAIMALHVAAQRRVHRIVAIYPTLHADVALKERLKNLLRRVAPRWVKERPSWALQRRLAVDAAREPLRRSTVPIFVVVEDRQDRTEAGRSTRLAEKWFAKRADHLRKIPISRAGSPAKLPEAVLEDMAQFARAR